MTDITQEYATDPTTGQTIAIDPPLEQSDAPLIGNPVLMRTAPRKPRSNTALYTGAAIAVVAVLAGGVYLLASGSHQSSTLMTNAAAAPPAQEEAAAVAAGPIDFKPGASRADHSVRGGARAADPRDPRRARPGECGSPCRTPAGRPRRQPGQRRHVRDCHDESGCAGHGRRRLSQRRLNRPR